MLQANGIAPQLDVTVTLGISPKAIWWKKQGAGIPVFRD